MSQTAPADFRALANKRDELVQALRTASEAVSGSIAVSDLAALRQSKGDVLRLSEQLVGIVGQLKNAMADFESEFLKAYLPRHRQATYADEVETLNKRQIEIDAARANLQDRLNKNRGNIARIEGEKIKMEAELHQQRQSCDAATGLALKLHNAFILGGGK